MFDPAFFPTLALAMRKWADVLDEVQRSAEGRELTIHDRLLDEAAHRCANIAAEHFPDEAGTPAEVNVLVSEYLGRIRAQALAATCPGCGGPLHPECEAGTESREATPEEVAKARVLFNLRDITSDGVTDEQVARARRAEENDG